MNLLISSKIPILGICFGLQWILTELGGEVTKLPKGEYGKATFSLKSGESPIFREMAEISSVWMSHSDSVSKMPKGFTSIGRTDDCEFAALEDQSRGIYLLQFHPESKHTEFGPLIFKNFLSICGSAPARQKLSESSDAVSQLYDKLVNDVQSRVGKGVVLLAVSGGADSTILCHLLCCAVPGQVQCVFIDTGLMRQGESEEVCAQFGKIEKIQFLRADAKERFFAALKGVKDPEEKRKAVGKTFIDVFEEKASVFQPKPTFFAQGTIYSDVIESKGGRKNSALIKSHHNVGGLPEKLRLVLLEPFRALFKDQIKLLGRFMRLREAEINRQPFPGPGLSIRVLGEVTPEKVELARKADFIFIGMLREKGFFSQTEQAFAALLDSKSVGVVGDNRRYGYCVLLRAVTSRDLMTARTFEFPMSFLDDVARSIISRTEKIARVFYDVTSKPPGTIELE